LKNRFQGNRAISRLSQRTKNWRKSIYCFVFHPIKWSRFLLDCRRYKTFNEKNKNRFKIHWKDIYPCIDDNTITTDFDRHYIYHPAWAARILALTQPRRHVDISSTLYFATIVSAFLPIEFYDYRPADLRLDNLRCSHCDITALPFDDNSVGSLSCMHVVEHIGLGRYGDPVDPNADIRAISELQRVINTGGNLLFVVPVGLSRLQFNAHRIYSYKQIMDHFNLMRLKEFSLIPDQSQKGTLIRNAPPSLIDQQNYACGCFWFQKI
jgi:hypothetical protein